MLSISYVINGDSSKNGNDACFLGISLIWTLIKSLDLELLKNLNFLTGFCSESPDFYKILPILSLSSFSYF